VHRAAIVGAADRGRRSDCGIRLAGPAIGTVLSAAAMPLWLVIVVASAAVASIYPAWKASKLQIREALSYQ